MGKGRWLAVLAGVLLLGGAGPRAREMEERRLVTALALDGGEDGLKFYRAIARKWKRALKPGGKLAFEVGYDQAPAVEYILAENGFTGIQTTMDPGMHWRVVEGSAENRTANELGAQ